MADRIFLPIDAAARSVGADAVANAFKDAGYEVVRTGSRGMLWLEPLAEIERDGKRVGFGPLTVAAASELAAQDFPENHATSLGPVEALDWMKAQSRLIFARCGVIDPLDLDMFEAAGGLKGLKAALARSPEEIVETITTSGLRGRGGAGFPAGIKLKTAAAQPGAEKYICANADEGDSGTFADRMLMEGDPGQLIAGMIIAGRAIGAETGYIYLRSEYPDAIRTLAAALKAWEDRGWLGEDILQSGQRFHIHLRRGAGSYVCGEESAMLESLEGKRGQVRAKPPIPAISGLFGKPTIINNVLTLASMPWILEHGGDAYAARGHERSTGTQAFQLAGNIRRGGLLELDFGISLERLVEDFGGGTLSGRPLRAVQLGGPLGAYVRADKLDVPMDYESLAANGAMLGHGGIVVFDESVDMAAQAEFAMEFCAEESCGKCTPCRIGAVRGRETLAKIRKGVDVSANLDLVEDLCTLMADASLCAMGGLTPMPVMSAIRDFPEDFEPRAQAREADVVE
ncbi:NADH-ubiquinone oxidoreductase-F iron-sulfur binding region domain-containing protein [Maricaulis sp.]|uniref:NADH-ubiquinone oxidoreductase-F iron-sulfur binding region domain-containing protein n=1 Tax=Maricaulis sp. TaxID=1486257 RepID=UPI00261849F7|nr:NADH-ubiquinone oxidoreductase-F iron-sulfur binding region domain-containing protein [Maricaulis sp.]